MTASRHHSGASPGPVCTSAPVLKGAGAVASPVLVAAAVGVESIRVIELSVLTYVVLGVFRGSSGGGHSAGRAGCCRPSVECKRLRCGADEGSADARSEVRGLLGAGLRRSASPPQRPCSRPSRTPRGPGRPRSSRGR
ncbi:Uncharacterised protein [Mycobacteroides abscessus]|nr:Uncharacterised protein [Mycobacteroides abscessus]